MKITEKEIRLMADHISPHTSVETKAAIERFLAFAEKSSEAGDVAAMHLRECAEKDFEKLREWNTPTAALLGSLAKKDWMSQWIETIFCFQCSWDVNHELFQATA